MSNPTAAPREKRAARPRGTGRIYQQPGSGNWWIKYHVNGKTVRESTGTDNKRKAEDVLNRRIGEVAIGTYISQASKVMMTELAADYFNDARLNSAKDIKHAERCWQLHLEPRFGRLKATQVSTSLVKRYINDRKQAGAEYGTINRELAVLHRRFSLAHQETDPPKVTHVPHISRLK